MIHTWETANSCWQPKHTEPHFPIQCYIDTLHLMRASAKFQRGEKKKTSKSLHGGYKNIIKKKRLISSQLVETSSSFGGGSGRGMMWGQWLSIEAWFMIHSVLHVCSQVSGSCTQLEQRGLEVCFREDKLKLDTFISARAAEELVTAYQKSFPLITRLKVCEIVTVPDKWKEESKGTQNVYKAQS